MAFKLDLSKFKKVHSDHHMTTLQHADGHKIQIAHRALSPKMKADLDLLPAHGSKKFADGGQVSDDEIIAKKKSVDDYNNLHEDEPKEYPQDVQQKMSKTDVTPRKMAAGGPVTKGNPKLQQAYKKYADGGDVSQDDQPAPKDNSLAGQQGAPVTINISPNASGQMAQVPPAMQSQNSIPGADDSAQSPQIAPKQQAAVQQQDQQQLPSNQEDDSSPEDSSSAVMQTPTASSPDDEPAVAAKQPGQPQLQQPKTQQAPDMMQGYQKQQAGIAGEAQAQGQLGGREAQILDKQAAQSQAAMNLMNKHMSEIDAERKSFQQDVQKGHIDPKAYMNSKSTGQKVMQGIGLILGGMGAGLTHQPNDALKMLNAQIDRDISAQRDNLANKQSLLAANMNRFKNLRDATDMTRLMMNDITKDQIQSAAAKSQDPMVKARAQQLSGQLDAQMAPVFQQLSMRQALQSGREGGHVSDQDPSSYVPYVVPEPQQKDVFKEIQNAQNASANEGHIMGMFDKANQENTLTNRAAHLGFEPASVLSLKASFLPMIHDAEGRVNEYEAKTLYDLIPQPGDMPGKVAAKKAAIQSFIQQKKSAPNAKAFGIDLDKFRSTTTNPEAKLNPQQQSFLQWARSNPSDPRSAMVMKKLGLQ